MPTIGTIMPHFPNTVVTTADEKRFNQFEVAYNWIKRYLRNSLGEEKKRIFLC